MIGLTWEFQFSNAKRKIILTYDEMIIIGMKI